MDDMLFTGHAAGASLRLPEPVDMGTQRRLGPQVVVAPVRTGGGALRIFVDVTAGLSS
ncbi:hypothetical protein [Micromonospora sp. AP08]|uniref:hypothetical protein n=1 Tax=Micromonospora sp. AP08 TaxID=2604467 RepID=UPI001CA36D00